MDVESDLPERLSEELGLPVLDRYFFFTRLGGQTWDFPWEPFRDLAGTLGPGPDAVPIVVVAHERYVLTSTRTERHERPVPHIRVHIGPNLSARQFARTWLDFVANNDVHSSWDYLPGFLAAVGLPSEDLSGRVQRLLAGRAVRDAVVYLQPERTPDDMSFARDAVIGHFAARGFDVLTPVGQRQQPPESNLVGVERLVVYVGPRASRGVVMPWVNTSARRTLILHDQSTSVWDRRGPRASAVELYPKGRTAAGSFGTAFVRALERLVPGSDGSWPLLASIVSGELAGVGVHAEVAVRNPAELPLFIPPFNDTGPDAGHPGTDELPEEPRQRGYVLVGGYSNDDPMGPDRLGITGEVNMLCSIVAARAVKPPLSIGLFGHWGAGKSFFMQKMMERTAWLQANDPEAHDSIVQIRFNAWHYMDANLWASLAAEIFERIVDPQPVTPEDVDARHLADEGQRTEQRAAILKRLRLFEGAVADLERRVDTAKQVKDDLADQLGEAETDRKAAADQLGRQRARDVAYEAAQSDEVKALRQKVMDDLGVAALWSDASDVARDLRTVGGIAAAVWRKTSKRGVLALLVVLVLALLLVGTVLLTQSNVFKFFGGGAVGAAIAAAAVVVKRVKPATAAVLTGIKALEQSIAAVERKRHELQQAASQREIELAADLHAAEVRLSTLSAKLVDASANLAQARQELTDLRDGRRLYEFLAERAADYRRQVGLVGVLHRDFVALDRELRRANADAHDEGGLPHVERVVLYIDDLDRCPPGRVMEVLQAVHLLLALPLFVVVVGVDPRWLRRSLEHEHRRLRTLADEESGVDLPQQYLEKIFQVPFALAEMSSAGFAGLMEGFLPENPDRDSAEHPGPPTTPADPPPIVDMDHPDEIAPMISSTGVRREAIPVQAGSAADRSSVSTDESTLDLTEAEVAFAKHLAPLVASPRSVKRMMNTYRMLRSTRDTSAASRFLAEDDAGSSEFHAVLMLLAVASGFVAVADELFKRLEVTDAEAWSAFLGDKLHETEPPKLAGQWADLLAALHRVAAATTVLDDIGPYKEWAPRVARFSFSL